MRKLARLVMPLVLLVPLSGCVPSIVATVSCTVGNEVSVSKKDVLTEKTASDIEANNESRRVAGCEAKG